LLALTIIAGTAGCAKRDTQVRYPTPPYHPWRITAIDPTNHRGTYLANGFMGMRIGREGFGCHKGEPQTCLLVGAYGDEQLVQAPRWSYAAFSTGRAWFPSDPSALPAPPPMPQEAFSRPVNQEDTGPRLDNYRQVLDMLSGTVITHYRWTERRRALTFDVTAFASMAGFRNLCVLQWRITPSYTGQLACVLPLGGSPLNGYATTSASQNGDLQLVSAVPSHGRQLAVAALTQIDGSWSPAAPPRRPVRGEALYAVTVRVTKGQPVTITRWVMASIQGAAGLYPMPATSLLAALRAARQRGFEAALRDHAAAMRALWNSDIVIDGSPRDQQEVRASLFYLLQSMAPAGPQSPLGGDSVAPMGLSSQAWGGHIFWDADMWMLPVADLLHPDLATGIVAYRFGTLKAARENAAREGMAGASYPTESAGTGRELAPDKFPKERHNTGDVAFAQWRHYLATGDRSFLANRAFPILSATADYWVSRVTYNAARDRYEVHDVVPPDETAGEVNNDVYTNAVARENLRAAIAAARILRRRAMPKWRAVADRIYIPFDPALHRYVEHDGFSPGRRKLKQADAQLLIFPLRVPMSAKVAANTLDYYASITSPHGPAMTSSIQAVAACKLGRRQQAYSFFRNCYEPFARPYFSYFSEKPTTDNCCFLTGCAGVVTAVLYGFAGLDFGEHGLTAHPLLPPSWSGLQIRGIHNRGRLYDLTVKADGTFTLKERAEGPAINRAGGPPAARQNGRLQ